MAVSASFHDFDLVGDVFGMGVGDGVVEVVEEKSTPGTEAADEAGEFGQLGLVDVA